MGSDFESSEDEKTLEVPESSYTESEDEENQEGVSDTNEDKPDILNEVDAEGQDVSRKLLDNDQESIEQVNVEAANAQIKQTTSPFISNHE